MIATKVAPMPEPYPFEDTLARLDEIDQWLCSSGYRAHDRIRKYRKNIRNMLKLQAWDENLDSIQNISEARRREILWSYVESEEFVRAVSPLRERLGDNLPAVPIHRALDGPTDLYLETQRGSQGRNFMFELIMGGRIAKAGFTPEFNQGPDVQFKYRGIRVGVQCKRPFSRHGLEESINKAISQLRANGADLSIIAISVSRIWNGGGPSEIPVVRDPSSGHAHLNLKGREIADESKRYWKEKLGHAGIFFYAYAPVCWPMENGRYGYATIRAETLCPVKSDDISTKRLLTDLAHDLGA